jgi:transcriptional regulator with XRE-family HTH domain
MQVILDQLSLGEKVKLERVFRKWTQADLAQLAKVSQNTISKLERGFKIVETDQVRILLKLGITEK